jgi:hypothetical protein
MPRRRGLLSLDRRAGHRRDVTAATAETSENVGYFDPRMRAWIIRRADHRPCPGDDRPGDRLPDHRSARHVTPLEALQPTGLVLMMGAGSALLAQWGLIPMLDLKPRALVLAGRRWALWAAWLTGTRDVALRDRDGLCAARARHGVSGAAGLHRRRLAGRWAQRRRVRWRARSRRSTARRSCSGRRWEWDCTSCGGRCPYRGGVPGVPAGLCVGGDATHRAIERHEHLTQSLQAWPSAF